MTSDPRQGSDSQHHTETRRTASGEREGMTPRPPAFWKLRGAFSRASAALATSEARDFERAALPLLRIRWPAAVQAIAMASLDRAGVDIVVPDRSGGYAVFVQCKGFRVREAELGESQLRQCLASIASFRTSGLKGDRYILVHNRDGRSREFRAAIRRALRDLVKDGVVRRAALWDRHWFLRVMFSAMDLRVRRAMARRSRTLASAEVTWQEAFDRDGTHADVAPGGAPDGDPRSAPWQDKLLTHVLVERGEFVTTRAQRLNTTMQPAEVADPADVVTAFTQERGVSLLIGDAGFGKTTTALRALERHSGEVLFLPAAALPREITASKDLVAALLRLDEIVRPADPADAPLWRDVAREVAFHQLRAPVGHLTFVIDGIDESVFFTRPGGLQHLFNMLRDVHATVLITARSELWNAKQAEFATAVGTPLSKGKSPQLRLRVGLVNLLPWTPDHSTLLVRAHARLEVDPHARRRLAQFADQLSDTGTVGVYGDLVQRPLFLRMIIDTIAEGRNAPTSRRALFEEWARLKIHRDVVAPRRGRGPGRMPILPDVLGIDETVETAFALMERCASLMCVQDGATCELLESCDVQALLDDARLPMGTAVLGLVLNSLLVPADARMAPSPRRVRFAHRAFQEYFTARWMSRSRWDDETVLPPSLHGWLAEFRASETLRGV